jgi:exonuclease III
MKVSSLHAIIEHYHLFENLKITKSDRKKQIKFKIQFIEADKEQLQATIALICDLYNWKFSKYPIETGKLHRQSTLTAPKNSIMTWNVGGLTSKRNLVRDLISQKRPIAVALQETKAFDADFPFTHPEYHIYYNPALCPGQPGLLLGIHHQIESFQLQGIDGNLVLAKCFIPTTGSYWIIGSVYIPCDTNTLRTEILNKVCDRLINITWRENLPIVIMGDWNLNPTRLKRKLNLRGCGNLHVGRVTGSDTSTRFSTNPTYRWSSLDHIVVNNIAKHHLYKIKIKRDVDASDHWPLLGKIRMTEVNEVNSTRPSKTIFDISKCKEKLNPIISANRWETLANREQECPITITDLQNTSKEVIQDLELRSEKPLFVKNRFISSRSRRLAKKASQAHLNWTQSVKTNGANTETSKLLLGIWKEARKTTRQSIKHDDSKAWRKFCRTLEHNFNEHNISKGWTTVKSLVGKSRKTMQRSRPLIDHNGILEMDPDAITSIWRSHFSRLASSPEPEQSNIEYWYEKYGIVETNEFAPPVPISEEEVRNTISKLQNNKAPGIDGIPNCFLKALASEDSLPLKVMTRSFNGILQGNTINAEENTSTIVPILKPNGNPNDPNCYRGISLINGFLKTLTKIIYNRLMDYCQANDIIISSQAGFLPKEEAISQVLALYDIIDRRRCTKSPTYACFIDFQKAFDTVPIGALLWKLHTLEIPRYIIDFIAQLYGTAWSLTPGSSEPIAILQGVRQGCPLSGLLFNIFINDIFDDINPNCQVSVPGVPTQLHGLLYADDVVVLATTKAQLSNKMQSISAWANKWKMRFGVSKCAIVTYFPEFCPPGETDPQIYLQNDLVPIASEYKYLGVILDNQLTLEQFRRQKAKKLNTILNMISPVLKNKTFTMGFRKKIYDAFMLGYLNYGMELFAGHQSQCQKLQTIANQGLRLIMGASRHTSVICMHQESNTALLELRACSSAVRLFNKSLELKTPLSTITRMTKFRIRPLQTIKGRKTWSIRLDGIRRKILEDYETTDSISIKTAVMEKRLRTFRNYMNANATIRYMKSNFAKTNYIFSWDLPDKKWKTGHLLLIHARIGQLWTKSKGVKTGTFRLDLHSSEHCILCQQETHLDSEAEISHLIVCCPYFQTQRFATGLQDSILAIQLKLNQLGAPASYIDIANFILGANNATLASFWKGLPNRRTRPLPIQIIEFLQGTMWQYYARLREVTGYVG